MSEQAPLQPLPDKKHRPGLKSKLALLEVIERKRLSHSIDYKTIALRHDISAGALRQLWMKWKRGEIDLGDPITVEEKRISTKVEHEKQLDLARRLRSMVVTGLHGMLIRTEDVATAEKDPLAYQRTGCMSVVKDLKTINEFIASLEKGYMAIVDEERATSEAKMKQAGTPGGPPLDVASTKIGSANDEERALRALSSDGNTELPPETTTGIP